MSGFDAGGRAADGRSSVVAHDDRPITLEEARARWTSPFDAWGARIPQLWAVCIGACLLVFAGHLTFGANTNASSLVFASLWLLFGGVSLVLGSRSGFPAPSALLVLGAICFVGVMAAGASQLLPLGEGRAHPFWDSVPDAAALTLDRDATLRELVKLAALAAAFCAGYLIGASDRRARFFFFLLIAASIVYSGWAFLQHFGGLGAWLGFAKPYHVDRLTASFLSANNAATALGMLAILAAGRLARAVKESASPFNLGSAALEQLSRKGSIAAVSLFLLLTCVLATQSRAGVAVGLAAILLFVAWELHAAAARSPRRRGVTAAGLVLAVGVGVAALAASADTAVQLGAAFWSSDYRVTAYEAHWGAVLASPWRGYGLGSFPVVNAMIQTAESHRDLVELQALHNAYLQWIEEAGAVGGGLMFACIGCILGHIWLGLGKRASMLTWLRAITVASVLVLAHALVDYALQVPSIAWQWALLLGVGAGLAAPRSHESRPSAAS